MSSRENLSRTSLYLQIFDILIERISSGGWRPGRLLPNEFDLAREFGVSAGTIRKALDKLEADRVIKRQHGKGSFVLDQNSEELAFRFSKIVDQNGKRAGDSQSTLLAQEIGEATPVERQCLALKGGGEIVRTRRLRRHHGRATRYETTCLAMSRLGITTLQQVGDYLIVPLAQQQGVHLARASEKLTVVQASDEVASLLTIEPGKMLLKLDRVIYALDGDPVEWRASLCDLQNEYYVAQMQ